MLTKRELQSLSRDAYELLRRLRKTIQTDHVIAATALAESIQDRLDDALEEDDHTSITFQMVTDLEKQH